MARRKRRRRPARGELQKEPKPMILVVTEGRVTEPEYLNGLVSEFKNPRVVVKYIEGAGVPKTIVEKAKDSKRRAERQAQSENDENLRYDEVWCVFDVDEHPNINDAKQMAEANDIELAISNPCFELWLLLHFSDPPGLIHRHDLRRELKKHIPKYNKHVDYSDFSAGYELAVKRASQLDDVAKLDGEKGRNPTTGVGRLTESIRADS